MASQKIGGQFASNNDFPSMLQQVGHKQNTAMCHCTVSDQGDKRTRGKP